jgi:ABC transporter, peptide/opine/nickel uptake transporter family, permease protein
MKTKESNRRIDNLVWELKNNKQAVFSLIYIIIILLVSVLVMFSTVDPDAIDVAGKLKPPSGQHWFGTDDMGRDYFIRVLYGGRVSLLVGILAMFTSIFIGVSAGMAAGYFGGIIDTVLMRFVDVMSSIPWIIMMMVIGMVFKKGLVSLILIIGVLGWLEIARLIRSEVLSVKERDYVRYAVFIGVSPWRIMATHILPAVLPTVITASTASIASAIMVESALSFLGRGVAAPMSSWGSLLQSSQKFLQKAPYMAVLPGIFIILTVFSFNKLGEVLRVFVEPKVMSGEQDGR